MKKIFIFLFFFVFFPSVYSAENCQNLTDCTEKWNILAEKIFGNNENSPLANAKNEITNFHALIGSDIINSDETENSENNDDSEITTEDETIVAEAIINDENLIDWEEKSEYFSDEIIEKSDFAWNYFKSLIPRNWRDELLFFVAHYASENAAYIGATDLNDFLENLFFGGSYNTLGIDVSTFWSDIKYDTLTLIHEFWHLFSLSKTQYGNFLACSLPFTFDCSYPESYINKFYADFWLQFNEEEIEKENFSQEEKENFFTKHKEKFINSYASGNPFEDFAESFTAFVITPKNQLDANSEIDQKQLFFYDFEEIVRLRFEILAKLDNILETQPNYFYALYQTFLEK